MVKTKRDWGTMRVNKTVSLDLDLLNQVLDEAEDMGKDFSATVCVLLRIGITGRSIQRERDVALSADERKTLMNEAARHK